MTPFHRDAQQSVNYEATGKLIDHLIDGGVNGIFIFGSNGEFHVIEEQEKYDLTKYVVEHIGGRVPVLSLIHISSTPSTILRQMPTLKKVSMTKYLSFHLSFRG